MLELNQGSRDGLEIYPNVWAGVGLVRGGAGTALVGSHEEVADRIEEYAAVGIEEFILSAYPHLEGAYWFGEGVLPILEQRGRWTHPAPTTRHVVGPVRRRRAARPRRDAPASPSWSATPSRGRGRSRPRRHLARELAGEPDLVVDLADLGAGGARLGGRPRDRAGRAGRCGRPGRRGLPDLQGHLHRAAQGLPRPLRRRHRPARRCRPADARRRPDPRPRAGAHAAPGAGRDRRHHRARPLRPRLPPRRPGRVRRLARRQPADRHAPDRQPDRSPA